LFLLFAQADTVTATQLSELQQRVRAVNSTALIVPTEHAKVNLKKVLELNRSCDRVIAPQSECSHAYGHHASHAGHGRQDGTISICFDFTEEGAQHDDAPEDEGAERIYVGNCALKFARFQEWLRGLVEDHQQNLFRVKGVLAIEGEPARLVVQGVHADIRAQAGSAWAVSTTDGTLMARSSRLVLIGKGIAPHAKNIRQSFEACLVENPSRDPSSLRNKKIL
jgi:G3E family GTPase